MRDLAPTLSDRLTALMAPPSKLDRFDEMAIDMIAHASSLSFKEARELIAAQLRLLHAQGQTAGAAELMKVVS
jgi:hypothetical protein